MLLWLLERMIIKLFDSIRDAAYTVRCLVSKRPRILPGIIIGHAADPFQPRRTQSVSLASEQRLKSVYLLGGTGSGKTKSIEGMVIRDMDHNNGLTVIDPHGDLTQNILRHVPTHQRMQNATAILLLLNRSLIVCCWSNRSTRIGLLDSIRWSVPTRRNAMGRCWK